MTIDVKKYEKLTEGPGRFEGEKPETAYYWEQVMEFGDGEPIYVSYEDEGDPDEDFHGITFDLFEVDADESEAFDLGIGDYLLLWTDSQGFIMTHTFDTRGEAEDWAEKYVKG